MKKIKKYTVEELQQKYWEFRKVLMTETVNLGYGYMGGGGSYTKMVYKDTIQDFLIWLAPSK